MKSTPLLKLYERLVTDTVCMNPIMQKRIVEHLMATKSYSLLGLLASRPDISPETDRILAKCTQAPVVAGWASRPGLTSEELIKRLSKDTRVVSLLPLAMLEGLPEEVYATLASHGSVKLTGTLMLNPSVSLAVRLAHVDNMVRALDVSTKWSLPTTIMQYTQGNEPLLKAIISRSTKPDVIIAALGACQQPPADWVESCIDRIDDLMALESESHTYIRAGASLLEAMACEDLTAVQLKKLQQVASTLVKESGKKHQMYYGTDYNDAKKMFSPKGRLIVADIKRLRNSLDVQESLLLVAKLLPSTLTNVKSVSHIDSFYRQSALDALPYNQVLPVGSVEPHIGDLSDSGLTRKLMLNWINRGEIEAVARCAAEEWGAPPWLPSLPDPLVVVEAMVKYTLNKNDDVPHWLLAHPLVVSSPAVALALLPWKCLSSVSDTVWLDVKEQVSSEQILALFQAIHTMIGSRLGDDPRKWEAFTTLANEFQGSLPDLLDTVDLI